MYRMWEERENCIRLGLDCHCEALGGANTTLLEIAKQSAMQQQQHKFNSLAIHFTRLTFYLLFFLLIIKEDSIETFLT